MIILGEVHLIEEDKYPTVSLQMESKNGDKGIHLQKTKSHSLRKCTQDFVGGRAGVGLNQDAGINMWWW